MTIVLYFKMSLNFDEETFRKSILMDDYQQKHAPHADNPNILYIGRKS